MDSTGDQYPGMRAAFLPMMLTGWIVATGASDDPWWTLWGVLIGACAWLAWVLVVVLLAAWTKTREERG